MSILYETKFPKERKTMSIADGLEVALPETRREEMQIPEDLYSILGLDMQKVRKLNKNDHKETIKKAYHKKMLLWHPDKNSGNDEVAKEINEAYNVLKTMSDEERASYYNAMDYAKGVFSQRRLKATFCPDCNTDKQKKAFRRRIGMTCVSFVLATGGVALGIATAGAAVPVMICGAIIGGGFSGAGFQSLGCIMSKKAVLGESDVKTWLSRAAMGFVGGVLVGSASLGIAAGIGGGLGSVSFGEYVGITSTTGAVRGAMSTVISTAAKIFVNKEKVTWKHFIVRAICDITIGAGAGALGALVPTDMADGISGAVASNVSKQATIGGARGLMRIPINVLEQRTDDSEINQTVSTHVKKGFKDLLLNALRDAFIVGIGGFAGHGIAKTFLDDTSYLGNAVSGNEPNENVPGLENETNEDRGAGEEDDDDREKKKSKQPYYARKKETSRPKNANVKKH